MDRATASGAVGRGFESLWAHHTASLGRIVANVYPIRLFIGRDGKVKKNRSGFAGSGTGESYDKLRTEMESLIGALRSEGTQPRESL